MEEFHSTWQFHNKLAPEQFDCAGQIAVIKSIGFYHGGDVLYWLMDLPGTWHEECLEAAP